MTPYRPATRVHSPTPENRPSTETGCDERRTLKFRAAMGAQVLEGVCQYRITGTSNSKFFEHLTTASTARTQAGKTEGRQPASRARWPRNARRADYRLLTHATRMAAKFPGVRRGHADIVNDFARLALRARLARNTHMTYAKARDSISLRGLHERNFLRDSAPPGHHAAQLRQVLQSDRDISGTRLGIRAAHRQRLRDQAAHAGAVAAWARVHLLFRILHSLRASARQGRRAFDAVARL